MQRSGKRTVRVAWGAGVGLVGLLSAAVPVVVPGTGLAQVRVCVEPADTLIALGDSVTVVVRADGPASDLKGFLVRLTYRPAVLLPGVTSPGDVLAGHGRFFMPYAASPDTLGFDGAVLIGTTAGPGTLGSFRFQGFAAGTSDLILTEVLLRDSDNEPIALTVCHGRITVTPPTPVTWTTWGGVKAGGGVSGP
jgi:hypothetical protein